MFEGGEDNLSGDYASGLSPARSKIYAIFSMLKNPSKLHIFRIASIPDVSTTVYTTVYDQGHPGSPKP